MGFDIGGFCLPPEEVRLRELESHISKLEKELKNCEFRNNGLVRDIQKMKQKLSSLEAEKRFYWVIPKEMT